MNDRQIESFLCIAEMSSFSKAAEALYISRQALKKQMDSLEEELQIRLFHRTAKGTSLTPEGERFYSGARVLFDDMNDLVEECRFIAHNENTVRVIHPFQHKCLLQDALDAFALQCPEYNLDIMLNNSGKNSTQVARLVTEGAVDVAEVIRNEIENIEEFNYIKIADLQYNCIVSRSHPFAERSSVRIEDLSDQTLGIRVNGNGELLHEIHTRCHNLHFLESSGPEISQLFYVCYRKGIFVSRSMFSTELDQFTSIPLESPITVESGIVFRKKIRPVVTRFIEIVKEQYT